MIHLDLCGLQVRLQVYEPDHQHYGEHWPEQGMLLRETRDPHDAAEAKEPDKAQHLVSLGGLAGHEELDVEGEDREQLAYIVGLHQEAEGRLLAHGIRHGQSQHILDGEGDGDKSLEDPPDARLAGLCPSPRLNPFARGHQRMEDHDEDGEQDEHAHDQPEDLRGLRARGVLQEDVETAAACRLEMGLAHVIRSKAALAMSRMAPPRAVLRVCGDLCSGRRLRIRRNKLSLAPKHIELTAR
mmetsp:Transcript_103897/g.300505  ORF Transcript_103897/g.300505 Transcript_103897/m.300505 type:complete len:241 (-) Transcript_103897:56-778(-)